MNNFDNFLADFSSPGNRYNAALRLVMSGKSCGMSADTIIERAHGAGVRDRDSDLRRLWNQSKVEPNRYPYPSHRRDRSPSVYLTPQERAEARRRALPASARTFVPITLRHYWTSAYTDRITNNALADTIRMGEAEFTATRPDIYTKQAARQLRALFRPGEKVWAGWIVQDPVVRARLGLRYAKTPLTPAAGDDHQDPAVRAGIIEAHVLADRIEAGVVKQIPTHVSLNPVTGTAAKTSTSTTSFDCAKTVAAWRNVLVEWDKLFETDANGVKQPSQAHIDIVAGLLDYAFETGKLRPLCAVHTGGKSIHVALRVKADTLAGYQGQTGILRDLFASADDEAFRVDPAGWNDGYVHIRLAGAIRPETGRRARLLWANP